MKHDNPVRVLFACLGNICRSTTAHGVFERKVSDAGLAARVEVDSCGSGAWHVGSAPDRRATAEALRRGYDLSTQRARQFATEDEVPDPYYGGEAGFRHVLDLVELASEGLLQEVRDARRGK